MGRRGLRKGAAGKQTHLALDWLFNVPEVYDGAIPSGNSVAMLNLLRLGRMTGDPAHDERAAALARAFSGQVALGPSAYAQLLSSVDFAIGPSLEIVIVGEEGAADTEAMLAALRDQYLPNKVVLLRTPGDDVGITELAEFTRYQYSIDDQATAYVCRNFVCEFPTTDVTEMVALMQKP